MAIRKIPTRIITDDAVTTAKIDAGAVDTTELADGAVTLAKTDSLFVNTEISGTEAARMPQGTTAQRANPQAGDIRFNTTLSLMEYYDGTQWKSIDSPPTLASADVSDFDTAGDTITLTGTNFQSGMTVKLIGADGTEYSASSVTVTNSTTASFDITAAMATDNDPFDIEVTNPSNLSATLSDALDYAPTPSFTVAAGSLGTIYDSGRSSISITTGATSSDADDTITYALDSGDSLPSGLSLNSSTGAITGDADAVGSDTTTTFDIVATATSTEDSGTTTNSRTYSITVKAPSVTTYTSSSGTYSVPSGITAVNVLVVAGGGGGAVANGYSGGGGAGGLIYRPAYPVTPGGTVSYSVGGPGTPGGPPNPNPGGNGGDSTFGTLTAKGGGGGMASFSTLTAGQNGGSGGGGSVLPNDVAGGAGTGTQPQQPGDSGTYGFGNNGGTSPPWSPAYTGRGGGGGGAGGAGAGGTRPVPTSVSTTKGSGGIGKQYDISGTATYYAGGGGGGYQNPLNPDAYGGYGGQGGGGSAYNADPAGSYYTLAGEAGQANRGGGGGGGTWPGYQPGGAGGSGVIIVAY